MKEVPKELQFLAFFIKGHGGRIDRSDGKIKVFVSILITVLVFNNFCLSLSMEKILLKLTHNRKNGITNAFIHPHSLLLGNIFISIETTVLIMVNFCLMKTDSS